MIEYFGAKSLFSNTLRVKGGEGGVPPSFCDFEARFTRQTLSDHADPTMLVGEMASAK